MPAPVFAIFTYLIGSQTVEHNLVFCEKRISSILAKNIFAFANTVQISALSVDFLPFQLKTLLSCPWAGHVTLEPVRVYHALALQDLRLDFWPEGH